MAASHTGMLVLLAELSGLVLLALVIAERLSRWLPAPVTRAVAGAATRLETALGTRRARALGLAFLAAFYLEAYLGHPNVPGQHAAPPEHVAGWWGWWDQGKYYASAESLSRGVLTREDYWYPLGYPLLGALFFSSSPGHPFLLPNMALTLASAALSCALFARVLPRREGLLVLLLVVGACARELAIANVIPWNTIPTTALVYLGFWWTLRDPPTVLACVRLSVLSGVIYVFRPGDATFLAPCILMTWLGLPSWGRRARAALVGGFVAALFPVAVALVNLAVFGGVRSAYDEAIATAGFGDNPVVEKTYAFLLDSHLIWRAEEPGVLYRMPWLLMCGPGVWLFVREHGRRALGPVLGVALALALYMEFNDFTPMGLYRYNLFHYVAWILPLAGVATYQTVRGIRQWIRSPVAWATLVLPWLVVTNVELREQPVASASIDEEGRLVVGRSDSDEPARILELRRTPEVPLEAYRLYEDGVLQPRLKRCSIAFAREDRMVVTFYKPFEPSRISMDPRPTPGTEVDVRALTWQLGWTSKHLLRGLRGDLELDVRVRGTADRIDLVGKTLAPDGRADVVVAVGSDPLLDAVVRWEVTSRRGRWVSWSGTEFWRVELIDSTKVPQPPAEWTADDRFLVLRANEDIVDRVAITVRAFGEDSRLLAEAKAEIDPDVPLD